MRTPHLRIGILLAIALELGSGARAQDQGLSLLQTGARDVELTAEDGATIHATFHPVPEAKLPPAVILVAEASHGREAWDALAAELTARGVAVLAIDPRPDGGAESAALIPNDIRAGVRFIREREDIDGVRVALVGAGLCANAAAVYAVDDHLLVGLGLLSPLLEASGLDANDAIHGYGARPSLLIAGEDDTPSAAALDVLHGKAQGDARVLRVAGGSHGVSLLQSFKARAALLEWLDGVFGTS
jgi:dienelactone hydrolase